MTFAPLLVSLSLFFFGFRVLLRFKRFFFLFDFSRFVLLLWFLLELFVEKFH